MNKTKCYVPRCGVGITFGCLISFKVIGFFGGSSMKTSKAAPPQCPVCNEFKRASSSTMPPRATLMMYTPLLHFTKVVALIKSTSNDYAHSLKVWNVLLLFIFCFNIKDWLFFDYILL